MIAKDMSESKVIVRTTAHDRFTIEGNVSPGFEAVREAFAENFVRRRELGGACCGFNRGEKVVDLWGGIRNKLTVELWERDTMVIVYSATKGLAATTKSGCRRTGRSSRSRARGKSPCASSSHTKQGFSS